MLCLDEPKWSLYDKGESYFFGEGGSYCLREVEKKALVSGARGLVGPISADTWHSYRAVTGSSSEPFFTLEPSLQDPGFSESGFKQVAGYSSSLVELSKLNLTKPVLPSLAFSGLDLDSFESELFALWQFSLGAFRNNFLYEPISFEAFKGLYMPLKNHIKSRYVLMVRDKGELVGYLFCFADLVDSMPKRLIVKTIARKQQRTYAGLGQTMLVLMLCRALQDGFDQAILALFKDDNASSQLSQRLGAREIRTYGLFARGLNYER